jgi:hypothetical protein
MPITRAYKTSGILGGATTDGTTIVADSAATTGLRWQGDYAAGKNRIINGFMEIDQRNAGGSVTCNSGTAIYPVDRFLGVGVSSDGVFTLQRDTDVPSGFNKSLKVTVTTADASIGATESYFVRQNVEQGQIYDFDFGKATAKIITLSFWVRSSLTGTFGGSLRNSAGNRSYPFSYSIASANTWERKSVTLTADTTGTWGSAATDAGVLITWSLGAGTDRVGTAGAWNSNNNHGATGQVQVISTVNATWYLTGVQLEIGSVATAFQTATGTLQGELAACRRYLPAVTLSPGTNTFNGYAYTTNGGLFVIPFDTPARVQPTGITVPTVSGNFTVRNSTNGDASATTLTFDVGGLYSASVLTNGTLTSGTPARLVSNANSGYILFTGCEL